MKEVEDTIEALAEKFKEAPTWFYTETDLVCWFVGDLNNRLGDGKSACDKYGLAHQLVHTEFPTPFRCDMRSGGFCIKKDDERTDNNGGFRRGHFDIVVLNPAFVASHTYHQLKAQDYAVFIKDVWDARQQGLSMLHYAVEFYFSRDPIASTAGSQRHITGIRQDAEKLKGARSPEYEGFVAKTQHIAFLKGASGERRREIEEAIGSEEGIRTVFAG
jgi:hypothetical protein